MFDISSRTRGIAGLSIVGLFIGYYTLWIIGLPFVEEEYRPFVARFFPSVSVGLGLPASIGSFVLAFLFIKAYSLVLQDRALEKDRWEMHNEEIVSTKPIRKQILNGKLMASGRD